MSEKYDLKQMLSEIEEDREFDNQERIEFSQEKIQQMMFENLRKRKAKTE